MKADEQYFPVAFISCFLCNVALYSLQNKIKTKTSGPCCLFYQMHVEQQRQLMMRERQQKQAAAAALAASSSTSTAPPAVDSTRTPPSVLPGATPGGSQQQQGNKRQLTLTVWTLVLRMSSVEFREQQNSSFSTQKCFSII